MQDYFDVPAVSNSLIGDWKKQIYNIPEKSSEATKIKNFLFGSVFHGVMAGEDVGVIFEKLPLKKRYDAMKMAKKVADIFSHIIENRVSVEQEYYWESDFLEIGTPIKCKAKTDLIYRDKYGLHCVDWKTTSCTSQADFLASATEYSYDRQAAWYFLADDFVSYTIIGVSKAKEHDIFVLPPFSRNDTMIQEATGVYMDILKKMQSQGTLEKYYNNLQYV